MDLEWGQMSQFNSFNATWDERMQQYAEAATAMRLNLQNKHADEIESETKKLDERLPKMGRPTAEWLNLKTRKENLVKVKRYQDAHDINV
jgi:hypothetical protein